MSALPAAVAPKTTHPSTCVVECVSPVTGSSQMWWGNFGVEILSSLMGQVLHGSARTTAVVRAAVQRRPESLQTSARRPDIDPKIVAKRRFPAFPTRRCPAVFSATAAAACSWGRTASRRSRVHASTTPSATCPSLSPKCTRKRGGREEAAPKVGENAIVRPSERWTLISAMFKRA